MSIIRAHTIRLLLLAALFAVATAAPTPASAQDDAAEAPAPADDAPVDLNTASEEELQRLPGVGPSRAAAIVERRAQRPFRRIEEIMLVRGIGRATFRRLRPMLTVGDVRATPPRTRARRR